MAAANKALAPKAKPEKTSRGIQSIEVGGQLLKALVGHGRPMALKDLASAAGMSAAKAHPYLVSFGKLGLIEQDRATSQYRLGSLAIELGLISLQQVDPVRLASDQLAGLAHEIGCTVSLAIWGEAGPVIVRVETGPTAVHVTMRHGMPASLRHTGTGKVFAAYMPVDDVEAALSREEKRRYRMDPAFSRELEQVRRDGIATVNDELLPGISAMAVPVFDSFGTLVMAIAAIGPSKLLDLRRTSPQAAFLKAFGAGISRKLGYAGRS